MRTKRLFLSILLVLVTCCLVACGKVSVSLKGESTVKVGETIRLTPEASKKKATFSWASDNTAVATVNDGVVTGVSAGVATITVTATSGKKSAEASIQITVTADAATNNKPVINGAVDKTIAKGSKYAPMEGITASDAEDGDLTSQIQCTQNVKPNVVGVYDVTYSVTDSDGNTTTVTIKITVEAVDHDAPLLTGVQDKVIVIGDSSFSLTDNVIASDTVDGDLTDKIQIEGSVDVWKLGEYTIQYSVKDEANNEAKATRKITVGLGEFQFADPADKEFTKVEADYQFAVALESINTQIAAFALAKLEFKVNASAACELVPSITNGTSQAKIALVAGENTVTVYFRVSEAIADGLVKLAAPAEAELAFSDVKFAFAEAKDVTAPVVTVPEGKLVLPLELLDNASALKPLVLAGVSANDNIDMVITSRLDVDLSGLDNEPGEKEVVIFVLDSSNNRGEATRTVEFAKAYSTNIVADPTFSTDSRYSEGTTDPLWEGWRLHGGAGEPEMYIQDGVLVHHNTSDQNPGYDSASCPIIDTDSTVLQGGSWYMLKFDVKAAVARNMSVRIGLAADAPVWLENFEGASNYMLSVSTEWETKYVVFYVHANQSENGYTGISCELKNGGAFDWNAEKEVGNTFYFDNLQFYLLSNENAAPTLTINKDLPTSFGKDQPKPDLTQYVIAYDREDAANITITASHITEAIDMATPGTYEVVYKVADSEGKEATISLTIKVLEEADTVAPVLAEAAGLVKEFDQFAAAPDITKFITATDAVDGAIEITMDMIETEANINKAGSYDIVYTVKDSSGNVATLTITIVVNDKEAPKVEGKDLKTYVGTSLSAADIIANYTASDNVDGAIALTEAMVKGLADVDFSKVGEYQVIIEVVDAAGNKAEHPVNISVREKGNTVSVPDEVILDLAPLAASVQEACTVTEEEGTYKIEIAEIGGWASANKMKFTPSVFVQGETYVLRFTAKADKARSVQFNIGEAMDGSVTGVWMEKYPLAEEGSSIVALGTDYATFDIMFTVQNEKFEWGPTIEFCVGPVAGACEAGNNIYFTELAIYSVKEIGDVDLTHATIDPQEHVVGEGLVISKVTTSGQWDWIGFKADATDLEGYTKIVAKVYGPEGGVLLFKPNDLQAKETRYTMTGAWQEIEHALDFTLDVNAQTLILMPDADVVGSGKYYLIASLELQGEGKDPINLMDATISKADACTIQKALTLTKPESVTSQWDCAKFKVSDDLTGYAGISYAIIGAPGMNTTATFKPNDNGDFSRAINLDGTLQEGIIDIAGMTYSSSKSAMILFVDINVAGTGNPVFILEMKYLVAKPGQPEPENTGHVEPIATAQSSADFATWDGLEKVTFNGLPAATNGGKWARWDFDGVEGKGYTDIVVQLKATPGMRINAKVDASAATAAGNNAYDGVAGNKTTLIAGEDGLVTFTWNIAELKEAIEAAGKVFDVNYLRKFVIFPSCGLEGDDVFTTGTVELISIDFVKNEQPVVYVPVYPEAVEGVDLIPGAINPKTINVVRQIRMTKTGGGQWNWVGLEYEGDLTGYTKMVATIIGPDGAAFTFKVNDTTEKGITTTGEAQEVEFVLPEGFAWDAAKKTMIMFPDFNIPGLGNEFTLTKLELQGDDKEPIDLLVCKMSVDANVQACRDIVLTKAKDNVNEWDCIEIAAPVDLTGYSKVHYVVRGTDGETLLIKPNNNGAAEVWLGLNGKVQEGDVEFNVAYDATAPAMILFPNPQGAGSGNPIVISQLVFTKEPEPEQLDPLAVTPTAVNQSASYIEWNDAKTVATLSNLKNSITGGQWGRWDYAGVSGDYTDVIVVLKVTPGLKVMAKLDALTTPVNNAYDGIAGNKQTLTAGKDGLLVYRWNVAEFAAAAQAAGKAFALENLQKMVFFACDGTGNAEVMASASVELVSITYLQVLDVEHAIAKTEELTGKVNSTYSEVMWAVEGTVKTVNYNDIKVDGVVVGKNMTVELTDGTNTIKAQYVISPSYLGKAHVGETLLVYGYLEYYNGASIYPKDKNNVLTGEWPMAVSLVNIEGEIKVSETSSANAEVKELSATKALNGSSFTFKVEVAQGHELVSVTINGVAVEAVEDVYTGIVDGETIISISTKEAGALILPSLSIEGNAEQSAGGVASSNLKAAGSGYRQTNSAVDKYYYQILSSDAYFTEAPAKIVLTIKLGAGSDKDVDDANAAYVVLLDKDGNEIESTVTMITKSFLNATKEYTVEITPTAAFAGIKIYETKVSGWNMRLYGFSVAVKEEAPAEFQVRYGGAKEGAFDKQEDGTYTAKVELAAWKRINFSTVDADGTVTELWYDNTTFTGLITAENVYGDQWGGELYHEEGDGKRWMPGAAAGYKFTYNPETHTMNVATYIPGGELRYGGAKQGKFVKGDDGIYTVTVALNPWNRISFALVDEDGNETALWYDNTTFTGKITAEDKLGDAWDGSLYHEADDGKRWMPGDGPERTYRISYNPQTRTLNVELLDLVAPTITISSAVQTALANAEFFEGQDASALFAQLLAGISANDNVDGAITVTQEMVNLGGLNPAALVAGDYKITITVADAAGNEAKQELNIHVKKYANVDLLADLTATGSNYQSPNWKVEKYTTAWEVQTTVQMRSRASNSGVKVANMANGYGMTMRFTYGTGSALGVANKLEFKLGNYWSNAQAMSIKIKVVTTAGQDIYLLGSASEWYSFHVTTDVEAFELPFDAAEIKEVVIVSKSSVNDSTYLYIGETLLSYEEPASSPAAFELTNLTAEGNNRNHIEGAGAWIWIDPTSIGLTGANLAEFEVAATCESLTVSNAFLSDYSESAVRCYVVFASAPAADATTIVNITLTHNGVSYQGSVTFVGNELA